MFQTTNQIKFAVPTTFSNHLDPWLGVIFHHPSHRGIPTCNQLGMVCCSYPIIIHYFPTTIIPLEVYGIAINMFIHIYPYYPTIIIPWLCNVLYIYISIQDVYNPISHCLLYPTFYPMKNHGFFPMILPVPVAGAAPRPLLASLVVHGKGQEAFAVVSPRKGEKWDGLAEMCQKCVNGMVSYGFIWEYMAG